MSKRVIAKEKPLTYRGYPPVKKWETVNKLVEDSIDCNYWMGRDFSYNGMNVKDYYMDPIGGTGPNDRPFDDIEIALAATDAQQRAILPGCHFGQAYFRVPLIQKAVDDYALECGVRPVKVIGTVHLNYVNGGLNPDVVKTMVRFGGKVVFMPTLSGWYIHNLQGLKGGIELTKNGKPVPALEEIMGIMADNDLILDITWVSPEDKYILMDEGKKAGIKGFKIYYLMTTGGQGLPIEKFKELAKKGLKIMPGQANLLSGRETLNITVDLMKKIGYENMIGGTDLNIWGLPYETLPVDGLRSIISNLLLAGLSESDIELIYKTNPAKLFGL